MLEKKAGREGYVRGGDGYEFEQAIGVSDEQGNLACCCSWGRRVGHD